MTLGPVHELRRARVKDIVGDRHRLVSIGMLGVWVACVVFGAARLVVTLSTGKLTPWWVNVAGAAAITALYLWYRRDPQLRSPGAASGTALVATIALLVPVLYGMTSTIWWLSLVGFAMVLLGRCGEAWAWGVTIPFLVAVAVLVEPSVQLEGAIGEPPIERGLAKFVFVILVVGMAAAFRGVAEQRARALHESEERYRMLFQRAPVGVFQCGDDLQITACNERFADFVGARPGEPRRSRHRLRGETRTFPAIQEALRGVESAYEGPYSDPGGRAERFVSVRTVPLSREDGSVGGVLGIVEDITELKRGQERALRQSEARYWELFDSAIEGIFQTSMDGKFRAANPALARMLGYASAEHLVKEVVDSAHQLWVNPDERARLVQLVKERGIVSGYQCEFLRKDGTKIWVSFNAVAVRGYPGDEVYLEGFLEDVTERKRAEDALRSSEERYRLIVTNTSDGIFSMDLDGRTTFASPHWTQMGGYTEADVIGRRMIDFVPEESRPVVWEKFTRSLSGETIPAYEVELLQRDGTCLPIEISMSNLADAHGKIVGPIGVFRDITERKRAEARVTHLNRLLRTMSAVNELIVRSAIATAFSPRRAASSSSGGAFGWPGSASLTRSRRQSSRSHRQVS